MSRSEHCRREHGGAVGADRDRGAANAIGTSIEVPRVTDAGKSRSR